jgi:hypothetical protein
MQVADENVPDRRRTYVNNTPRPTERIEQSIYASASAHPISFIYRNTAVLGLANSLSLVGSLKSERRDIP